MTHNGTALSHYWSIPADQILRRPGGHNVGRRRRGNVFSIVNEVLYRAVPRCTAIVLRIAVHEYA